jgi:hypothetical protein
MPNQVRWIQYASGLFALLLLLPIPQAFAQVDDPEPNDTPSNAINIVTPYFAAHGSISHTTDRDYYSFWGEEGQVTTIWVQVSGLDSDLVPALALYDSTDTLIAYNYQEWNMNQGGNNGDPILYLKLPKDGRYYAVVSSASNFGGKYVHGTETGAYVFELRPRFGLAYLDPNEPNDTRVDATAVTVPYKSERTNLLYFGDVDWYQFHADRGEILSIDIDALEMQGSAGWDLIVDAHILVFDEAGLLLSDVVQEVDPDTGYTEDPAVSFQALETGTYYVAVTTALNMDLTGPYNNPDFLDDPEVSSAARRIGDYGLTIRRVNELYFPQIANGSFGSVYFTTTIILINPSNEAVAGTVSFYGSGGVEMETNFEGSSEPLTSNRFNIPAKASFVMKSDGTGPGMTGYAKIVATGPVGGSAVFSEHAAEGTLITEAAVGASTLTEFFTFPVDVTEGFNTGIAIANPIAAEDVLLYIKLLNLAGETVATRDITLAAGNQMAIYVSGPGQLFPGIVDFRGSLQVFADAAVPAVALRSTSRTMTTLPPVEINQSFQESHFYFPQVVVGTSESYYRTTIILTNPGYFPISGQVQFRQSDGNPMNIQIGPNKDHMHGFTIPPQGTVFMESAPTEEYTTGYATLTASHAVGAAVIFSQYDSDNGDILTEVGVPDAPLAENFLVFVQHDDGYNTGVAIANVNQTVSEFEYLLRNHSEPLQSGPFSLEAGEHSAELISGTNQIFPDFVGSGTLEVSSTRPIPAVALRLTAKTMTAVPVLPIPKN